MIVFTWIGIIFVIAFLIAMSTITVAIAIEFFGAHDDFEDYLLETFSSLVTICLLGFLGKMLHLVGLLIL